MPAAEPSKTPRHANLRLALTQNVEWLREMLVPISYSGAPSWRVMASLAIPALPQRRGQPLPAEVRQARWREFQRRELVRVQEENPAN